MSAKVEMWRNGHSLHRPVSNIANAPEGPVYIQKRKFGLRPVSRTPGLGVMMRLEVVYGTTEFLAGVWIGGGTARS